MLPCGAAKSTETFGKGFIMSDFYEDMRFDALDLIEKQIDELRTLSLHTHLDGMASRAIDDAIHKLCIASNFQKDMIRG